jgi:WD40 repeat protein
MLTLIGCDFRDRDFSHAVLTGANFTGADLSNCKFQGADLTEATFANATLTDADFAGADLTKIDIREFRRITCIAWGPERLVVGGEDGSIRIYSSVTWELEAVLRDHLTPIHSILVSPAEQFLFTVSDDRLVAWSMEGTAKFAEFLNQNGEVGPIRTKFVNIGYQIEVLSEHTSVFASSPLLSKSVDELELTVRTYNCLKNAGVRTIRHLIERSESDLLGSKNFGKKSLNELRDIIESMGLHFGMEIPEYSPSTDVSDEPYQLNLLDMQVAVSHKAKNITFTTPLLAEMPAVACYSARDARLAVGTEAGRVITWDVRTSTQLADLEQGKLDCTGMRLVKAKGLDQSAPQTSSHSLGEWLARRGAILTRKQLYALEHRRLHHRRLH